MILRDIQGHPVKCYSGLVGAHILCSFTNFMVRMLPANSLAASDASRMSHTTLLHLANILAAMFRASFVSLLTTINLRFLTSMVTRDNSTINCLLPEIVLDILLLGPSRSWRCWFQKHVIPVSLNAGVAPPCWPRSSHNKNPQKTVKNKNMTNDKSVWQQINHLLLKWVYNNTCRTVNMQRKMKYIHGNAIQKR